MPPSTVVIGAGSHVGRMLRAQWGEGARWLSRADWTAGQGPGALAPLLAGARAVICLAGATPGAAAFDLNRAIGAAVVEAAAGSGARVLLASTQAVYGDGPGPHAETGPVAPAGVYGTTKLEMERNARARARACGVALCCLRLGNVVGADRLFRNIAAGGAVGIDRYPDGRTPARSYIDPERLALALRDLVTLEALPEVLNLASAPALQMGALADAAGVVWAPRPVHDTARAVIAMDVFRARALLPALDGPVDAAQAVAAWRRVEGAA